jgi:uncharacterized protein YeaO (DUF488 family)
MPIKTKRWSDLRKKSDGFRLLVCRFRPRALKKEEETWDAWWNDLGPSSELHAALYGKTGEELTWEEFITRYTAEMNGEQAQEMIAALAEQVVAGKTITLLCSKSCSKASRCHRTLLKALIEERIAAMPGEASEAARVPQAVG